MRTKNRELANVEEREMQYLYEEGGELVFVDRSNGAEITVSKALVGDAADLMTDTLACKVTFFNERVVDVTLPTFVQLDVSAIETSNATSKATVETGAVIHVPPFIRVGDTIKIDTRTHEYVERVERLDN